MLEPLEAQPLPGLLWLPDAPAPAGGWPLIVFLHGYDEAAPAPLEQALTRHGPLHPGNPPAVRRDFILVAPQLPQAGDHWLRFDAALLQILEWVLAAHPADPARCYLSGFSFGGNGVFDLGIAHPRRWAALWSVDPTRLPRSPVVTPLWLSIGQVARRLEMRFIESLELSPAGSEPQGERLYLDEGADHVGSARLAYRDPRIYAWLLAHRRGDFG
ncbi:carboxylesterase family protein [Stutzerimonas azotifigens]|uniref:carboxylesterase family protein n=1 Tax=Stutzerimonas azotifigens TaxID=291995 RepID=UPI0004264D23|nr:alpha/beta hydrolase [Stutzerimonas azotifigens]